MIINKEEFSNWDKIKKTQFINSLSGLRSANLIGTLSSSGNENLAIFNSVTHIGASPARLGFLMRPETVERQTLDNIRYQKQFTINQVTADIHRNAHLTSAKFDSKTSEFGACKLTPEYIDDFFIPFVKESPLKMAFTFEEEVLIKSNNTILVVGRLEFVQLPDTSVSNTGFINFEKINGIAINALNAYYDCRLIGKYPFARPHMKIDDLKNMV